MRRLFTAIACILLTLPLAASAQQQKIAWELRADNYIDVLDLGFRFYFPLGWVYDVDTSKGIVIAETQADLDAQIDNDDSTQPEGLLITIQGIPLSAMPDLGDNPTLDKIADAIVKGANIQELDRVVVPVMSRLAISVRGTNNAGRAGRLTLWRQDGFLVMASLGTADTETAINLAYTWGATLAATRPLNALELGDDLLTDEQNHFTLKYPKGWSLDSLDPNRLFELADDIGLIDLRNLHGYTFSLLNEKLTDMDVTADTTRDEFVATLQSRYGLETAIVEDFIILHHPAVTLTGELDSGTGRSSILTAAIMDGRVVIFRLIGLSKEKIDAFMPTWVDMLRSIRRIE